MEPTEAALLALGGLVAGIVNTLAGGGSLLTVPLLVSFGLPGTIANGTNRVGVVLQTMTSAWRFRAEGIGGWREALPILVPVVLGSAVGALGVSQLADETFERVFGVLMLLLLVPVLRGTLREAEDPEPWPLWLQMAAFFGIGLYGGAFQAGVGLILVFALKHAGHGWVHSNSIKVIVVGVLSAIALPVFVWQDQIAWGPALTLGLGFAIGGELGARLAIGGGDRLIRPAVALAVVAMAGRMVGLY